MKTVVFLSGKGGSGKTTVAIAFAKLLSDIGKRVVLIDFDLSTNGASYFFRTLFGRSARGLWEWLAPSREQEKSDFEPPRAINVADRFDFIPSRVSLGERGPSYDSISYAKDYLKAEILSPLLVRAISDNVDYVLIDCQAGFAVTSTAASELGDMAIVVSEADAISSDAADNLLIQLGSSLPSQRKYLVNKIDIRDADTYRQMKNVFQTLNRLPPLPFDFEVRNSFGARQIPIDVTKPSPLLFALLETLKSAFPEIQDEIESYKKDHIDVLFEKYDESLQKLLARKASLQEELADIQAIDINYRQRMTYLLSYLTAILSVFATLYFLTQSIISESLRRVIIAAAGALVGGGVFFATFLFARREQSRLGAERKRESMQGQLDDLGREIDRYRSLLLVKSRDYLVDVAVAGIPPTNAR